MANYHFFAVCPRTLEPILAQELQGLGAQNTKENPGGVLFEGPWLWQCRCVCTAALLAAS